MSDPKGMIRVSSGTAEEVVVPTPPKHGAPWSEADLAQLVDLARHGQSAVQIGQSLGRTANAIELTAARLSSGSAAAPDALNWLAAHPDPTALLAARPIVGRHDFRPSTESTAPNLLPAYQPRHAAPSDGPEEPADIAELMVAAIDSLPERDRHILDARLGLQAGQPRTLEVVGVELGITRERVRQLQVRALRRVRALAGNEPLARAQRAIVADPDSGPSALNDLIEATLIDEIPNIAADAVLATLGFPNADRQAVLDRLRAWRRAQLAAQPTPPAVRIARPDGSAIADRWFSAADWPSSHQDPQPLARRRSRNVEIDGDGFSGGFMSTKLGRDVEFESRMEWASLRIAETAAVIRSYCEQPAAIPYHFAGKQRTYYADIAIQHVDGRVLLAEIKTPAHYGYSWVRAKTAAGRQWAHQQGWGWVQLGPGGSVVDLEHRVLEPAAAAAIDAALSGRGELNHDDLRYLRQAWALTLLDLSTYATQRDLVFDGYIRPTRLAIKR